MKAVVGEEALSSEDLVLQPFFYLLACMLYAAWLGLGLNIAGCRVPIWL